MTAFNVPTNAAFDSYPALVAAINDWLDRNDLDGVAGQMIALAEARLRRELVSVFNEKTATVVVTGGIGPLPADYGRSIRVVYDAQVVPSISLTDAPDILAGPRPIGYTIEGQSLRIWPANDVAVSLFYHPTIPQLTSARPTNELLSRQPDLYFFGAMMFAEGYLANDNRSALFKGLFDEAIEETKRYYRSQRYGGPLVPRINCTP